MHCSTDLILEPAKYGSAPASSKALQVLKRLLMVASCLLG